MMPIDAFPHLLNVLFGDLSAGSSIVISYKMPSAGENGREKPFPMLTRVNGCSSVAAFADYLLSVKASFMAGVTDMLTDLEPPSRHLFLSQVISRCHRFAFRIVPLHPDELRSPAACMHTHYGFYHPGFDPGDGPLPDHKTKQYLIWHTRNFANMWRISAMTLFAELKGLCCLAEFFPVLTRCNDGKPVGEKIPVNFTVSELGALIRVMYEANMLGIENKEKICRLVVGSFSTSRQKMISAGSLKNQFDAPTPEILDRVYAMFGKMMHKSQKLKNFD